MKIYVANKETGGFISEVDSIEEGKSVIEVYEKSDKEDGTYVPGFYDVVDETHMSLL